MLGLDDIRWNNLNGGYRTPFDPRPLLARLETDQNTAPVWHELWEELHHQGDVGETSFAVDVTGDFSRIYAGQHFRSDHIAGKGLGRQVAESVDETLLLPR